MSDARHMKFGLQTNANEHQ